MSNCIVEVQNLRKDFNGTSIFRGVNFRIMPRETVSICGNSGSGKTTLVNVLSLLEPPTQGNIFWQNENVTNANSGKISQLRPKIFGYIFQQCNLIPELNVLENLLFPTRIISIIKKSDIEFAKKLLGQVNLCGIEQRNVSTLSGGERQRVAAVRAMINHPKIIIADEPTGNLDVKSADATMDMIMNLCDAHGSSLLLITHNQRFAERMQTSYVLGNASLKKLSDHL
ncbi:MAG: ATP-binding cassette domain-containing protein [Puniceicoccales bacterium]|jgi:ABC-type lipoprotein export system ATPase subunit|nr:ATP-binding cassette domain-containing protein [Puniceicoccales bacterium]